MRTQKEAIMQKTSSVADIGATIRAERKRQGFTQTELAELSNVGLTYLSNLENGKETAEAGKMLHIVRMLGMDLYLAKRGE